MVLVTWALLSNLVNLLMRSRYPEHRSGAIPVGQLWTRLTVRPPWRMEESHQEPNTALSTQAAFAQVNLFFYLPQIWDLCLVCWIQNTCFTTFVTRVFNKHQLTGVVQKEPFNEPASVFKINYSVGWARRNRDVLNTYHYSFLQVQ